MVAKKKALKQPPLIDNDGEVREITKDDKMSPMGDRMKNRVCRGKQIQATKVPVSIRLSQEVVDHFKARGSGWQSLIDYELRKIIARK